jgi:HEPN domain-containing protein
MKPVTAEWVGKAEEDYAAALHLGRKRKSPVPSIVCFHCQQCAEKYLKALLVEADIRFPKTHDLLALLKLLTPVAPFLVSFRETLEPLNDYAVEFRYPSESATREEARTALVSCRAIRRKIRRSLGLDGPPSAQINLRIKERRARYKVQRKRR